MKIMSVVGARPNFMKVAPIINEVRRHNRHRSVSRKIQHVLVHTGQHYDEAMSDAFFKDLHLPKPDVYLGVGSGSHAAQTAEIMKKFESVLLGQKPDVVLVVGDVNSTVACALVASKISYDSNGTRPLIAHVEAGLRSFDRTMPEEINRILTDHLSDFLFVTEESGIKNLKREGVSSKKIHFVGNTMIDTLFAFRAKAEESNILDRLGLRSPASEPRSSLIVPESKILPYALLTLHRPSNVDKRDVFMRILEAVRMISKDMPVVFPCHPRTEKKLHDFDLLEGCEFSSHSILLTSPLGYVDFLNLMANAKIVLTDSGGIQEETTCLGVSCITLRDNTERPVTIEQGTNILAGTEKDRILASFHSLLGKANSKVRPKYWDGAAAERIVDILVRLVRKQTVP